MINNSPFDDHIKKQFDGYAPEVPSHIWKNIAAKNEKRKPVGFWSDFLNNKLKFFLVAIIIAGGIAVTVNYTKTAKAKEGKITAGGDKTVKGNLVSQQPTMAATSKENTGIDSPTATPGKPVLNAGDKTAGDVAVGEKPIINSTTKENTIVGQRPTKASGTKENIIAGQQSTNSMEEKYSDDIKDKTANENVNVGQRPTKASGTKENMIAGQQSTIVMEEKYRKDIKDKTANENVNVGQRPTMATAVPTAVVANSSLKNASADKLKKQSFKRSAKTDVNIVPAQADEDATDLVNTTDRLLSRYILNLNTSLSEKIFSANVTNSTIPFLNIPCPTAEKNAAGNKRYFEVYAGPDYAFRSFEDTANSVYLQKRKESTKFSYAFSAGIRFTKVFSNAMSFRTGINYSQVNERFKFEQGNIIQVVYSTDIAGDTTGSYTSTATRFKTTYNSYKTIDVPLLIGYEFGNGRLHVNLNAGAVVNMYSWQKGDLLDTTNQPVSITTGKTLSSPYQFKTNIGLGFMGAGSFYYKLNNSLHILAEPYIRYNFSAANKAELTLKQKYTTIGVRLGVRMDF